MLRLVDYAIECPKKIVPDMFNLINAFAMFTSLLSEVPSI